MLLCPAVSPHFLQCFTDPNVTLRSVSRKQPARNFSPAYRRGNTGTLVLLSRFLLLKPCTRVFWCHQLSFSWFHARIFCGYAKKGWKYRFYILSSWGEWSCISTLNLLLQHQGKLHVRIVCLCRSLDSCDGLCVGRTFEICSDTEVLHWLNTSLKSHSKGPNSFFLVGREFTNVLRHLALDSFPTLLSTNYVLWKQKL